MSLEKINQNLLKYAENIEKKGSTRTIKKLFKSNSIKDVFVKLTTLS